MSTLLIGHKKVGKDQPLSFSPGSGNQVDKVFQEPEGLQSRHLVKEALLGCICVLARELRNDSTLEKNEGGGEERFNETPSYGVYLISIHTPSGYASGF